LKDLKLHWWRLEEDLLPHVAALTHLGRLSPTNAHVGNQLCFMPKGIEYLKNLQQLDLELVSMELQNRIEGEGSLDSLKVHYIW
ncbi:hypothetical protein CFP56_014898, partial [Quercus suber]